MKIQPFYDLDSPIYLFCVPTVFFLVELASIISLIFIFKISVLITLVSFVTLHLTIAFLYRWSPHWIEKIIFYLSMPYVRLYKDNISYVPDESEFIEKK